MCLRATEVLLDKDVDEWCGLLVFVRPIEVLFLVPHLDRAFFQKENFEIPTDFVYLIFQSFCINPYRSLSLLSSNLMKIY